MWQRAQAVKTSVETFQSTHPRRVWPQARASMMNAEQFQSTHPRRVWLWLSVLLAIGIRFQSTHPRRVWHTLVYIHLLIKRFNPHTHAGCDLLVTYLMLLDYVSIHTPTQGVTFLRIGLPVLFRCFNPHTHAGCDDSYSGRIMFILKFQSTHPRRVWLEFFALYTQRQKVSIHTPTQGVTRQNM